MYFFIKSYLMYISTALTCEGSAERADGQLLLDPRHLLHPVPLGRAPGQRRGGARRGAHLRPGGGRGLP